AIQLGVQNPSGLAVDGSGALFVADFGNRRVLELPLHSPNARIVGSGFGEPAGVAVFAPYPAVTSLPGSLASVGNRYSSAFSASAPTEEGALTFRLTSG